MNGIKKLIHGSNSRRTHLSPEHATPITFGANSHVDNSPDGQLTVAVPPMPAADAAAATEYSSSPSAPASPNVFFTRIVNTDAHHRSPPSTYRWNRPTTTTKSPSRSASAARRDGWMTAATTTSNAATSSRGSIRRSASATLSADSTSHSRGTSALTALPTSPHQGRHASGGSHGHHQHFGSSVTFCNTVGGGCSVPAPLLRDFDSSIVDVQFSVGEDGDEDVEDNLHCSRSQTPAFQQNGAQTTTTASDENETMTNRKKNYSQSNSIGNSGGWYRGQLAALTLPVITCDGVATMPSSPTQHVGGAGGVEGSAAGSTVGFGSTFQLHPGVGGVSSASAAGPRGTNSKTILVTPHGSFLAVNQSPLEFRESSLSISYPNCYAENSWTSVKLFIVDDGEEMSLVYSRLEKIPMKDFAAEIRAHLDVEHFLSQAQLMLDMPETNTEDILDRMLHHLLDSEETPAAFHDASKVLFTHKSVRQLSKTIQCTCCSSDGNYDYDHSWICVLCTVASVQKRHVAIARLRKPALLGRTCQEVWFIILVVTSTKEKGTKNALETGRTFATLFADTDLRVRLLGARTENDFKRLMWEHMKELAEEQQSGDEHRKMSEDSATEEKRENTPTQTAPAGRCWFAQGLRADWSRRIPHYISDYKDGFIGANTLHKTISTTFFLYFACILPAIALGVLNYNNTGGQIDVTKTIYSQTIGGLIFAILGGQPMIILLTTAPLALYTKVIYNICEDWGLDFASMYACTGLWNSFFLFIYAFTDASNLMKWCTRSTEEIFALFISMAFAVDAFRDVVCDFQANYHSINCHRPPSMLYSVVSTSTNTSAMQDMAAAASTAHSSTSSTAAAAAAASVAARSGGGAAGGGVKTVGDVCSAISSLAPGDCRRENSLLYLLLMLGTVWLGLSLYNFTKTPFLNASKRELLADCALPVSVIIMSFFGSYVFRDVKLNKFKVIHGEIFKPPPLSNLEWPAILGAMGLGFCLSLLIFMDHNIAGAMVNSTDNRVKKGPAYHWDLMIVALLNAILAFFGLPLVHGALPHSPLHVRAMADVEDRVCQGHVYLKIVCVRETRVTAIMSHVLIGLSVLFIDQLKLIPRPVLDGLFLYLAITALHSNQLFERIMLLVTEQTAYPPNHYIRTVPQRKIHLFTFLQLLQLGVLCGFGFAPIPYLKMVFPVLHLVMLPIRYKLVPHLVDKKYLLSLDGH